MPQVTPSRSSSAESLSAFTLAASASFTLQLHVKGVDTPPASCVTLNAANTVGNTTADALAADLQQSLDAALVLSGRAKGDLIASAVDGRLMLAAKNGTNTDVIFLQTADNATQNELRLNRAVSAVRIEAGRWNPITTVKQALWSVFGDGGIFGANIIVDETNDNQSTMADVVVSSDDKISDDQPCGLFASYCQFNVHLKQNLVDASANLSFDIGVPGFGLKADGQIRFELGWEMYSVSASAMMCCST